MLRPQKKTFPDSGSSLRLFKQEDGEQSEWRRESNSLKRWAEEGWTWGDLSAISPLLLSLASSRGSRQKHKVNSRDKFSQGPFESNRCLLPLSSQQTLTFRSPSTQRENPVQLICYHKSYLSKMVPSIVPHYNRALYSCSRQTWKKSKESRSGRESMYSGERPTGLQIPAMAKLVREVQRAVLLGRRAVAEPGVEGILFPSCPRWW